MVESRYSLDNLTQSEIELIINGLSELKAKDVYFLLTKIKFAFQQASQKNQSELLQSETTKADDNN